MSKKKPILTYERDGVKYTLENRRYHPSEVVDFTHTVLKSYDAKSTKIGEDRQKYIITMAQTQAKVMTIYADVRYRTTLRELNQYGEWIFPYNDQHIGDLAKLIAEAATIAERVGIPMNVSSMFSRTQLMIVEAMDGIRCLINGIDDGAKLREWASQFKDDEIRALWHEVIQAERPKGRPREPGKYWLSKSVKELEDGLTYRQKAEQIIEFLDSKAVLDANEREARRLLEVKHPDQTLKQIMRDVEAWQEGENQELSHAQKIAKSDIMVIKRSKADAH